MKSIAKNFLGIDLLNVKVAKEKEIERELSPAEELTLYENEIKELRINPQNLNEDAKYRNKLAKEKEVGDYPNRGWEMVQTVNSKILARKKA